MANEAVIIELFNGGRPLRYTCADGTGIEKGTMLYLSGDRTVAAHSAADQPFVGIAAAEKVASDGATTISAYTNGIFDLTAAAAGVTVLGRMCMLSGTANMITAADADSLLVGDRVGQCLEAHANDEVAAVRINI